MTKPKIINIAPEVILYISILLLSFSTLMENTIWGSIDGFLVWGGFFVIVFLISERAIRKKMPNKALPSVFLFGFLSGSVLWGRFVLVESRSEGLPISFSTFIFIAMTGCAVGLVAMSIGYIYKKMREL